MSVSVLSRLLRISSVAMGIALAASPVRASWAPTTVAKGPGIQYLPHAVTDGSTGSLVAWSDYDQGAGTVTIRVQHVLATDALDPSWPAAGLVVSLADTGPTIVPDGSGGAVVAMARNAGTEIRAYHVLSSGALDPAWPASGVLVTNTPCQDPVGVTDGSGGAIFAWTDGRNSVTTGNDLFAQRVRSTGVVDPAWPLNGFAVCTAVEDQEDPVAVTDGSGGMIVAWDDLRNGADQDVFAQRILPTGALASGWTAGGKQLTAAAGDQSVPRICSDGAAGAIVTWADGRTGVDVDIYAMRVRSNGGLGTGWHSDGEVVCTATANQEPFDEVADGSGGAIVSWFDFRSNDATTDIYVQKVTASGTKSWTTNGVAVCTAANYQVSPSIGSDGAGGVFVAWQDRRFETANFETEIFVHHVLSSGSPDQAWPLNGARVTYDGTTRFGGNFEQPLVVNGSGIVTVFWAGEVNSGHDDVYSLRMTTSWTVLLPLQVSSNPAAAGSVTKSPDRISYPTGASVALTAVPGSGHTFVAWSGDASGSANPVNVTMNSFKSVTAVFDGYAVNVTVSSGTGTVSKSPDQALYLPGSQVTLTANPGAGFVFGSWGGDVSGTTNPLVLTVDGPKNITAGFTPSPPSCGNWSPTSSGTLPSARVGAPLAWDPIRHRVLMFGGYDGSNYLNDIWQFTLALGWSHLSPVGTPPSARDAAGLIYDPVRDRLLVVCGNSPSPPRDVYALSLSGTPTWSLLSPAGTPPPGRFAFSTIYDPIRDRVLLFGGYPETSDTWSLSLAGTPTWTQLLPTGSVPNPRYGHVAVYDPVRDRMIVHGGANLSGGSLIFRDTYSLSLGGSPPAWSLLSTSGPQLYQSAAIYDPIRDRMVLVAGNGPSGSNETNGAFSLSLPTQPFWSRLPVGGLAFDSRYFHGDTRDADTDALLVFGGSGPSGLLNDVKRLDCAGGWWLQTGGDNGSVTASPSKACYSNGETVSLQAVGNTDYALQQWLGDASGNNPVIDVTMNTNKVIFAQFYTGSVGVGETPLAFALEEIHPNPNPGPVEITYLLPRPAHVKLGVYDLAGRLVGRIADGVVEAGRHTAVWDGRTRHGSANSGIYFIRYETPAGTWTKRLALLR
jgi:hypothetical protein